MTTALLLALVVAFVVGYAVRALMDRPTDDVTRLARRLGSIREDDFPSEVVTTQRKSAAYRRRTRKDA